MMSQIFGNRKNQTLLRGWLVASVIVSGIMAVSSNVSAVDTSVDELTVNVPVFCNLSSTGTDSHEADIIGGTYTADIGTTTIKAICNDNEGFSIYATGYTGNEIGETNSNKLVSGNNTIATGLATGPVGGNDVSNWAMKLSTTTTPTPTYPLTIESDTEGSFTSYHSVPNTYTKVATRSSGTDVGDEAVGSTFTTTYATYISGVQAPGTYVGQVKYTLVHPATEVPLQPQTAESGCINYFPNGGNVEGTMGCQTISSSATSATLLASNFSRAGYGFAGWSDKYDYATNPSAKFYGPNEDITFTAGQYTSPNNGLSLYAVWVKSQGNLQDSTKVADICNSLTAASSSTNADLSSVSAFTDQRDGNTYAIAKLADNKCWMTENLRLESADTVGNNRFDSSVTNQSLAQGYGTSTTYGNFSGLANAESANFQSSTIANSLYYSGTQSGTASINIGTSDYPGYRMSRYNNTNTSARANSPTGNGGSIYSYGNYYTWHAAIADLAFNNTNNSSVTSTSLCPTGWHLPQGGRKANVGVSEFWKLSRAIIGADPANFSDDYFYYTGTPEGSDASNKLRTYPNNFLYSGYIYMSSASFRGACGNYWSSTAVNGGNSYNLSLYSSIVYPGTSYIDKYYGRSIRCVAGS